MKKTIALSALLLLPVAGQAQTSPGGQTGPMNVNDVRVHPGFTMTSLIPAGSPSNWPRVSGLDFLPNGDLAVSTWDGFGSSNGSTRPGRVFIFKNALTGDSAQVTYAQFGTGSTMNEPLGLKVSDGEIYIVEKDSLVHLVDANKDQVLDSKQKVGTGWTRYITDNNGKDLSFAHGLVRLPQPDGRFIIGLATRWQEGSPGNAFNNGPTASTSEKGCVLGLRLGSAAVDTIACGIRSPDGIALGPEDGIFVTDNHGHYVPTSKLVHVKQGRFFNVRKTQPSPFENATVTRPVLWLPHGDGLTSITSISRSPTQPVYLRSGVFAGQMLAGDNNMGTLQRYALEKVGGEFQGAVFRFSGGLRAAAHRIVVGPDSAIYIGGIGATGGEWGGWAWNSRQNGLQRMKENGQPFFDVLRVRSTGATTFEIDFTEPLVSADLANFTYSRQWEYVPVLTYGSGKQADETLTIQSVSLSADKKTVTLTIPGLKRSNVVHLRWSGLTAVSGRPLMTDRTWYTLNEFGPGAQVSSLKPSRVGVPFAGARGQALPGGHISVNLESKGPASVRIYSMQGRLLESMTSAGIGEAVSRTAFRPGLYTVKVGAGAQSSSFKVTVF